MRTTTSLSIAALLVTVSVPASADDVLADGARSVAANRISGTWSTDADVRPCGTSLPFSKVRNTITFHDGGTVTENPRFPPSGVPNVYNVAGINQRSIGLGTWSFDHSAHQYEMSLRFDWYVDGVYNGYQTVDREITMSKDHNAFAGSVRTTRYDVNGGVIADLCGSAVDERL